MKFIIIILTLFIAGFVSAQNKPIDNKLLTEKNEIFSLNGTPYTGSCFEKYPSGAKGIEGAYKDGKKDDVWVWYYENGSKKRETNYRNGKIHGLSIIWYKNGQKRSEIIYDNGQNVKQYRWDEEGNFLPPPQFGGGQ